MPQSESNELGQNRALAVDKLTAGSFGLRSGKQRQVAKRNFSGREEEKTVCVYAVVYVTPHSILPSNINYCPQ